MAQEQQQKPKKRNIIIPVAIILTIIAGGYFINESKFQSTDDAYIEADIIQVTPKVSGHIVESYIQDNKEVKAGEVVAKIDDEVYKERYEQAKANYEKAFSTSPRTCYGALLLRGLRRR